MQVKTGFRPRINYTAQYAVYDFELDEFICQHPGVEYIAPCCGITDGRECGCGGTGYFWCYGCYNRNMDCSDVIELIETGEVGNVPAIAR